MFIKKVEYANWRQHEQRTIELGAMTVIRGPNGSGKTNLIDGIVFGLTGETRGPGLKEDNVRQLSREDDHSHVRLFFRHGAVDGELLRSIRPERVILSLGDEVLRGANKVNKRVEELLGVDADLLSDYVFVPQWQIFSFVTQQGAARAKAFARLFGLEKAELIYRTLGDAKIPDATRSVDRAAVEDRLRRAEEELSRQTSLLDAAVARRVELEAAAADRKEKLAAFRAAAACRAELARLDARQPSVAAELTAATTRRQICQDAFNAAHASQEVLRQSGKLATATSAESEWQHYETAQAAKRLLEGRREALTREIGELEPRRPTRPAVYLDVSLRPSARAQITESTATLMVLRSFVASCDPAAGILACPTCGTPTSSPAMLSRVDGARKLAATLDTQVKAAQASVLDSDNYDQAFQSWQARLQQLQTGVATIDAQLAAHVVPAEPSMSRQTAVEVLRHAESLRAQVEESRKQLDAAKETASRVAGQAQELAAAYDEAAKKLAELPAVSEDDNRRLEAEEVELSQVLERSRVLAHASQLLKNQQAECQQLLQTASEEDERCRRVETARSVLLDVRAEYHHDKLPAMVTEQYLVSIRSEVNLLLERFDGNFRVESLDGLRLVVRFRDGRTMPAERLSGGEKVILALAFRVAVNLALAENLGILCLDEPTAGLDADNLKCVEIALGRLQELGSARGLQFVLITHENGLDNLCDRVIDLAATP